MSSAEWIVRIARRPWRVAVAALAASALAVVAIADLRVHTTLVDLLPEGTAVADDYRIFLERFGGLEKVFLLVLPDGAGGETDETDLIRAAITLEEALAASPEVASVRAGLQDRDEEFFLRYVAPRAPLLLGAAWRDHVVRRVEPAAIRRRVARLKATLQTPAGGAEAILARSDPLGFSADLALFPTSTTLPLDPLTSTFVSRRGDAALLILTPARSEIDPAGGRALAAELAAACDAARAELGATFVCRAVGGPLYAAQDERALRRDLRWTLTGSLIATSAILVIAFEGLLLPATALVPLLFALLWTGAGVSLAGVDLNAVSIGFSAVLVGLGIDYGIHGGARFRRSAAVAGATAGDAAAALRATLHDAGPGILTSATTTAAAFATLGFAHLRPLREVGLLVAVGILAILVATATLGAAGLVVAAPRLRPPGPVWRRLGRAVEAVSGWAARRAGLVLAAAAVLSAVALWGLGRVELDADPRLLRPENHPAHVAEELLVEHFGLGLDTANVVVHGRDLAQALERAGAAAEILRRPGVEVSSPADHLVTGAALEERLARLAELPLDAAAARLEDELRSANLDPRAFARGLDALRALGRGEDPGAPPPDAWPDWLAESLRAEADGTWTVLNLRLASGSWPDGPPASLTARVEEVAPSAAFASTVALGAEIRDLAAGDLRTLAGLALAVVVLLVVLSFGGPLRGRLRRAALATTPVVLGTLWTVGLWSAAGGALNLFSLAILPILLGIGLDDGLHVVHGARLTASRAAPGRLRAAVVAAGHALVLTTLTTCVGFGSLSLSSIPALRGGGLLIAAGVAACLAATLLVLPAVETVLERNSRSLVPLRRNP